MNGLLLIKTCQTVPDVCLPRANLITAVFIMRPGLFSSGELETSARAGWVIHRGAISTIRQTDTKRPERRCLPSVSLLSSATKKLFVISAEIRVRQCMRFETFKKLRQKYVERCDF